MLFKNVVDYTANGSMNHENDGDVRFKIANTMIDRDYPVAEIAKITGLSIDEVEDLK